MRRSPTPKTPKTEPGSVTKPFPRVLLHLAFLSLLLLGLAALTSLATQGCQPQADPEHPDVTPGLGFNILYLRGTGAAGLQFRGMTVEAAWTEKGVEASDGSLVHCSVVERAMVDGLNIGSGYLPSPFSNPACEEHFPPFRLGAPPLTVEGAAAGPATPSEPGHVGASVEGSGDDRPVDPGGGTAPAPDPVVTTTPEG